MSSGNRILETLAVQSPAAAVIANSDRSVILVRSFFPATEGVVEAGSHLKLGVCVSGGGRVRYCSRNGSREWHWGRSGLLVTAPRDSAEFSSPDVDMIGLAVDLEAPSLKWRAPGTLDGINGLSSSVMTDEVVRSIIVALWTCAEYHGPSGAFIDAGIEIICQRLAIDPEQSTSPGYVRPLSPRQLGQVADYVVNRLAHDIRVPELAAVLGMEPRRFSRAMRAATGVAPYNYLVGLRMDEAKKKLDVGMSVIDTALFVGYQNPGKFSAAFRRIVGCTPSEWQRRRS